MATTNHDRVGKALDLLRAGLGPFVEREVNSAVAAKRLDLQSVRGFADDPLGKRPVSELDVAGLLRLMWEAWNAVFRAILGPAERGLVGEMRGHRNRWAHQESFSSDDAYRALDSASRLLVAVSAPQSDECDKLKMELLRVRFDEQSRGERRKQAGTTVESAAAASLKRLQNMSLVEVRDHVLWAEHIHGNDPLKTEITELSAGCLIELEIDGFLGTWEKMADGKDGRPTFGIKPRGTAQTRWHELQARRGACVTIQKRSG